MGSEHSTHILKRQLLSIGVCDSRMMRDMEMCGKELRARLPDLSLKMSSSFANATSVAMWVMFPKKTTDKAANSQY